ncbi:DUF4302 domain-containing protein [Sphingobacterium psychroaquaticum]|uniref:Uncharacterized protein n=1 Tax=Sphingobacterium psychroaquaticum TaxID=561061 RepID=A0A1X7JAB6_9SPHI|nr:DUF4302 domain-containing protein [Sphingobacterium psychroaquaticum]QBQ39962.1 DUF4302 domain-containing protein [Sphingobacterium psychroaquaticum]SMG24565.1 protein of unknown function [Sphingobacterium psychroaquaticum]
MKLRHLFIICLLPLALIMSCKRTEDPIFDKNASARMTEAVAHAHSILQANKAGWLMKYFPSGNREFGGYTLFAKFISNAQVTLTSDVDEDILTSTYSVLPESGVVLSLNGFNKIVHIFTEPGMDNGGIGADDTGMKGDFEFIVLEATPEKVLLKGKKSGNEIVLLPLNGNEFDTMPSQYQDANEEFLDFGVFNLKNKAGELVPLTYNMRTFQDASDANSKLLTFRVIPGGLEFYGEAELDGVKFSSMKYVKPNAEYRYGYYTDESGAIKIVPNAAPLNVWFRENLWSTSISNVGATGKPYWNTAKTNLTNNKLTLNNYYIGTYSGIRGMVYVMQGGALAGLITHNLVVIPDTEDQVRISLEGQIYNLGGGFSVAQWTAGLNQLTTPFNNRTFRITGDGSNKPRSILLTDTGIPTNTFRLYLDDIDDPLNK